MNEDELAGLLEGYFSRLQAGETVGRAELEQSHPEQAAELWRHIAVWKNVAGALPGLPGKDSGLEGHELAIRFHSMEEGAAAELLLHGGLDPEELAQRLAARGGTMGRYRVVEEIARGAMGAILRVEDLDLGRELAMKVMLVRGSSEEEGEEQRLSAAAVSRFVEEARITGRLEHPGILPVHDFGVDDEGNFYFTMPWVHGHTLREIFRRVREGVDGWSTPRALGLLLHVCDALAYAHAQGVVHRDIKPRNIMVGEFGEVVVLDWGLARDGSRSEVADVRLATPEKDGDSPVVTRDGVVIGTPCYMSPEQARGELASIGAKTDIYAIGAVLYELLAQHPPYAPGGSNTPAYGVVRQVQAGPPASVLTECDHVPAELAAICEKAMARSPEDRYGDVMLLGNELRAFLEGRVVATYATGAWAELRKWAGRNQGVSGLAALLLVVMVVGGFLLATVERGRREVTRRELDLQVASNLLASADDLPMIGPGSIERILEWLALAEPLEGRLEIYHQELLESEEQPAREPDPVAREPFDPAQLAYLEFRRDQWTKDLGIKAKRLEESIPEEEAAALRREIGILTYELTRLEPLIDQYEWEWSRHRPERLVNPSLEVVNKRLWDLETTLTQVLRPGGGALARVRARLAEVRALETSMLEEHAEDWKRALASIADREQCPLYQGLVLQPVHGLLPLGRNGAGLWEFWHVLSGERPKRDAFGAFQVSAETGLVFILVPGGARPIGAQDKDPEGPNYRAPGSLTKRLRRDEASVRAPLLKRYFLSKFEMTQGQWARLAGSNPSKRFAGTKFTGVAMVSPTHPVEHVAWSECRRILNRWGLGLPTEAQWEVAARAGSEGAFWWGNEWPPPKGLVNFWDDTLADTQPEYDGAQNLVDGFAIHAPVDSFSPNPWGFMNVTGNVAEWCLDWYKADCYGAKLRAETGEVLPEYSSTKAHRGGSFTDLPAGLTLSRRPASRPEKRTEDVGVRPVFLAIE